MNGWFGPARPILWSCWKCIPHSRRSDIRLATSSQPPNPRTWGLVEFVHLIMGTIGAARPSSPGTLLPSFIYSFFHVLRIYHFTCGAHGARWSPCPFPYSDITLRDSFWEIARPT